MHHLKAIFVLFICIILNACGGSENNEMGNNQPIPLCQCVVGKWSPPGESRGTIILHQGHDTFYGSYTPSDNLMPVVEKLVAAGYTVYGVEMPPMPHDGLPLSAFTETVYKLLDDIGPAYMVGLSGGGWTTTLVTATDARIIRGYSVAGDIPEDMRILPRDKGDYEQWQVDYRQLYEMAGSRLMHIYNEVDNCCFDGITGDVGYPYKVFNDNNGIHKISDEAISWILNDIETNGC